MQGDLTIFPNEAIKFGTKVTDSLRNGLNRKVAYILKERKPAEVVLMILLKLMEF